MKATDSGQLVLSRGLRRQRSDLDKLAELIEETTGNVIPQGQFPHLEQVARDHARRAGFKSLGPFVERLEENDAEKEWQGLLGDVTIKESFLFRIPEQFRALDEDILPRLARRRPVSHRLRVWSAGCARGEEPATLAVVLAECPFLANRPFEILATDVDESALAEARQGLFGRRATAQVPPLLLQTWFEERGDGHALDKNLLRCIEWRKFNFFRSPYLSLGSSFDLIFLRNVLIYFSPESQRQVIHRVIRHLAPDGYLFLGHSESLWQLSEEMEPVELGQCFAYRKRSSPVPKVRPAKTSGTPPRNPQPPPPVPANLPAGANLELSPRAFAPPTASPSSPPPASVPGPPAEDPELIDPQPRLEDAVMALVEDHLDQARVIVDRCLEFFRSSSEVYALSGLLHDLEGRAELAAAAYRKTLYLEPGLFQIRFLLAHRLEHLGWMSRARQEYRQVLTDLEKRSGHRLGAEPSTLLGERAELLERLLPTRDEAARRCRRALARI